MFQSWDSRDKEIATIVAKNLDRGITYIYAFQDEQPYDRALNAIKRSLKIYHEEQIPEAERPKFCKLDLNKNLQDQEDIHRAISTAAAIFDEPGTTTQPADLRGYTFIEFYPDPSNDRIKHSAFFPILLQTVTNLVEIVENGALSM